MASSEHTGPVGYTGFVHPAAEICTKSFSIGGASLIEPFVSLEGDSAQIGVACNLQDNDRLLDFAADGRKTLGDLALGDGSFTAHGVTFIGKCASAKRAGRSSTPWCRTPSLGTGASSDRWRACSVRTPGAPS